ncbi:TauD/TfdA family dioxygenase [Dactylosporangium roseum]|uniref:TauD/TfdA family dioxygenase n=1 Tax=Dactylosporangium roseum TaxID=47989 RepID=A0ABY5ZEN1_9ACTN|nr:TauD/TfdA family dioxygenase [Dactylosporangium roseum]UWZ39405.1 TauD/TfdA family dioxygenase [Dactylosporangium roseum]
MSLAELLSTLSERDVRLDALPGGGLRFRAPAGAMTEALADDIRRHRAEIRAMLADGEWFCPLSVDQLRLWMLDRLHGTSPGLCIGGGFRLATAIDEQRLRDAVRAVALRQPALRARVVSQHGSPVLAVGPRAAVRPETLPVRTVPVDPRLPPDALSDLIAAQVSRPFDLATGPLYRVCRLVLGEADHVLVLAVHHVVADNHSISVLAEALAAAYARGAGRVPATGQQSVDQNDQNDQESHLAAWAARARRAAEGRRQPDSRRRLALLDVAPRLPAPAATTQAPPPWQAGSREIVLSGERHAAWYAARQLCAATTLTYCLALTALAVAVAGGPSDLLIGTPDVGRESDREWGTIGCFNTTMLLRVRTDTSASVQKLIRGVAQELGEAQRVRYVPYEALVGQRASSASGGFVLWVATYDEPDAPVASGLGVQPVDVAAASTRHDLRVAVFRGSRSTSVTVTYRLATVAAPFADSVARALEQLFARPPRPTDPVAAVLTSIRSLVADRQSGETMSMRQDEELLAAIRARRRAGDRPGALAVEVRRPAPAGWAPAVVEAKLSGVDLDRWVEDQLDSVRGLLTDHHAVLLRGFAGDAAALGRVVARVGGDELVDYVNRSTPRSRVEGRIFTSTEYPSDQHIRLHSEQSYATTWPLVLGFRCETPAREGGQTPLARTADVARSLPPDLVERFDAGGLVYERWFQPHLDLPWQEVFQTDSREEVARYCAGEGIAARWHDGDILQTVQTAQATLRDPRTAAARWFNQVHLFHPSALPEAVRAAVDRSGRYARNVTLGDGTPIPDVDVEAIRQAYERNATQFDWVAGDVLIVDNLAVAHGRRPFTGPRKVLVAMAGTGTVPEAGRP